MNLHLLMIEDSESDANLIIRQLEKAGYAISLERLETPDDMKLALDKDDWEIIIADYQLPEFDAPSALTILQETGRDIPFIVVSGAIGEETAVAIMRAGACDYLMKDNLTRLAPAVKRELSEAQNRRKRKQAEDLLRLQAEALNAAANAIVITNKDGTIEWVNPAFTSLTGFSPNETIGKNPRELVRSGRHDQAFYKQMWDTILSGDVWRGEMVNRRKNGQIYFEEMTITPVVDSNGQICQFIAIKQDITKRKHAEEQLRNSQEQYRYLVELSPDAIFVNRNNRIDFVNPAALDLFGATEATQILNKSPYDIFHPDYHSVVSERIRQLTELRKAVELIEEKIVRLDGSVRDVEVTAAPFVDSNGNAIQVILRDITERKQAEKFVYEKNEELKFAYEATLQGWSNALELREHETAGHSLRVVQLTLELARTFGFDADGLVHIRRGALLHDIGKMGIPDNILLKPGPLSEEEWAIMRKHPVYAYDLLSKVPYLLPALDIPHYHHEAWDGSGYPSGLTGEAIPLAARIFSVVDVWDALAHDRPYRPGWKKETVIEYLKDLAGKKFDPRVVNEFLKLIKDRNV